MTADRTPTSEGPRTLTPDEERFRGLVGAWNDDTPLSDSIRLFADMLFPQYRGWAEMMRGWAFRIDREAEAAASPEERGAGADEEPTP